MVSQNGIYRHYRRFSGSENKFSLSTFIYQSLERFFVSLLALLFQQTVYCCYYTSRWCYRNPYNVAKRSEVSMKNYHPCTKLSLLKGNKTETTISITSTIPKIFKFILTDEVFATYKNYHTNIDSIKDAQLL